MADRDWECDYKCLMANYDTLQKKLDQELQLNADLREFHKREKAELLAKHIQESEERARQMKAIEEQIRGELTKEMKRLEVAYLNEKHARQVADLQHAHESKLRQLGN